MALRASCPAYADASARLFSSFPIFDRLMQLPVPAGR
jgi:hypothetical protein